MGCSAGLTDELQRHVFAQGINNVMELAVSVADDCHCRAGQRCNLQHEGGAVVRGVIGYALRRERGRERCTSMSGAYRSLGSKS